MQFNLVNSGDSQNLTVVVGGQMLVATDQHPNWDDIYETVVVEGGSYLSDDEITDLFDVAQAVSRHFERVSERVMVNSGRVYFDGEEVHSVLTDHILRAMSDGEDMLPLVNFFENVSQNPNEHSRENLYRWLQTADFTIDVDGNIIAYKGVKVDDDGNFRSIMTGPAIVNGVSENGNIGNPVGAVVEMDRSTVTHDPSEACAFGLHAGTWDYAHRFGQGATLKVKINPRDVVSVPTDANDQKMRVCRYTVLEAINAPVSAPVDHSEYEPEVREVQFEYLYHF